MLEQDLSHLNPKRTDVCALWTAAIAEAVTALTIASEQELVALLTKHEVDIAVFGLGKANSIADLFEEVANGFTTFTTSRENDGTVKLWRQVSRIQIKLGYKRLQLRETHSTLRNGGMRESFHAPTGFMRPNEPHAEAAKRVLKGLLRLDPADFELRQQTHEKQIKEEACTMNAGLMTRFVTHSFEVKVVMEEDLERIALGSSEGTPFSTEQKQGDASDEKKQWTRTRMWQWYTAEQCAAMDEKKTQTHGSWNTNVASTEACPVEEVKWDGQGSELTADSKLGSVESKKQVIADLLAGAASGTYHQLHGGFSGSLVMYVGSVDAQSGQNSDACVIKLDFEEEVKKELAAYRKIEDSLGDNITKLLAGPVYCRDIGTLVSLTFATHSTAHTLCRYSDGQQRTLYGRSRKIDREIRAGAPRNHRRWRDVRCGVRGDKGAAHVRWQGFNK
jgi:hypothetical protein